MTKSELILRIGKLNPYLHQRDAERIVTTIAIQSRPSLLLTSLSTPASPSSSAISALAPR
jgi:hypothetical protein